MSDSKRPKGSHDHAGWQRLRRAIDDLESISDADELQPGLDSVATSLRQVFTFPAEVRTMPLDELLGFLESEEFDTDVSGYATFNELVKITSAEDYDNPSLDEDALQILVNGLRDVMKQLEAR